MASLMREHQSTKETYERLLQKSQSAQQAENLERRQKGEQFRVIDPARLPEKPFSPDIPKILLIGLLAGHRRRLRAGIFPGADGPFFPRFRRCGDRPWTQGPGNDPQD